MGLHVRSWCIDVDRSDQRFLLLVGKSTRCFSISTFNYDYYISNFLVATLIQGAAMSTTLESAPYVLTDAGDGKWSATFVVPRAEVDSICAHSILCQGAVFDLMPGGQEQDGAGTVSCTFSSRDAERTAEEIGKRIARRLQDPSPPTDNCTIS